MSALLNPIEAHERTIGQVFTDLYAFEIPPYQRPYAWEKDQASALLTDLLEAMDNTQNGGVYFLGSIVLIKTPNDPQSKVIDGQQRLTTLTVLLSVLRDMTSDNEVKFSRRSYVFQKANPDSGTQDRYRLLLRQRDRAFFQKYIQNTDATGSLPNPQSLVGSQQRLAENVTYFRSELANMDEARRNALVAFLIQRCYVVVVAVPTADAARRIFTVLNARGMDLTPTDMLKANLLERAGGIREPDLAQRWEAVEISLGRDEMVELFGHIRMIYERDKPRVALETGFSKFVLPFNDNADEFVSGVLEPIADAYLLLLDNSEIKRQFGVEAAKAVRSLERIDNKDWLPPALLRLWKRKQSGADEIALFMVRLERLAYYLFITRADVNERMERFAGVMDEFEPRQGRQTRADGLELSRFEQGRFLAGLSGSLYLSRRVCKPVLQRLDEALSSGGATYDDLISIEHVLPQTVDDGSEWSKLFADDAVRSRWTHRLANLVLLTRRINTRASNWGFDRKKKEYFVSKDGRSPFVLTQEVLEAGEWDLTHLENRQAKLLTRLCQVWQLDPELINQVIDSDDVRTIGSIDFRTDGEGTWRDDVHLALRRLGGKAHLDEIYREVKVVREEGSRSVPPSLDAIVRRVLEENSSDTKSFRGLFDIFSLSSKGSGTWALK
jgi:Protein of unknown function DUF262/Protein of unknown function (DUF1524)